MPEIASNNAIPPTGLTGDARGIRNVPEFSVHVLKECHRHPFPYNNEIRSPVIVKIRQKRIADHSYVLQSGGDLRSDIGEFYMALLRVIAINETADGLWVSGGRYAAEHEQIQLPVVVIVKGPYT